MIFEVRRHWVRNGASFSPSTVTLLMIITIITISASVPNITVMMVILNIATITTNATIIITVMMITNITAIATDAKARYAW